MRSRGAARWPLLLALLMVLAPTACVLWFLSEAVQNERLAVRQKLLEVYGHRLPALRERIETYWQQQAAALDAEASRGPAPAAFAAIVRAGLADSVVCFDATGKAAYPAVAAPPPRSEPAAFTPVEQETNDPAAAAEIYDKLAKETSSDAVAACAIQARARCLVRIGRRDEVVRLLDRVLGQDRFRQATDAEGRLIVADGELRAVELIADRSREDSTRFVNRLRDRLNDYNPPLMPAAQRRFLMHELTTLSDGAANLPTAAAEDLAASYLETGPTASDQRLRPSGVPDVWRLATPSGRAVTLFRSETVVERAAKIIAAEDLPGEVRIAVSPPEAEASAGVAQVLPLGAMLPGWRLTLALSDSPTSSRTVDSRVAADVWIAVLVIAAMTIAAVVAAEVVRRQMRAASLKNDLLATVSHELKTPLTSMRLLVDTLLDTEPLDVPRTREYLQLVAKENARLSRVIENFLSFSRMERGKQAFDLAPVAAAEIVGRVVEAAGERFLSPACRLEVMTESGDAAVRADADSLVTALLNLLDNAYKYSGDAKHIVLHTTAAGGEVAFAVRDNGIGLSARAIRKVFRPFYQVDKRLSREAGGCGLGLSIVKFIIRAHHGRVRVESVSGAGSTFTIVLPAV